MAQSGLAEREGWPERLQRLGQPLEHNGGRRHGRHDARIGRATHAKLADEVEYVGGPAGDARYIEISDVTLSEPDPERLWSRYIDLPKPNTQTEASAVDFMGWVLGKSSPAVAIELLHDGKVIRRLPLNYRRPDIAKARPDVPGAENSGFHATVSLLEAASEFEVSLQAVLEDQSRVPIGVIRGRRRWGDEEEERPAAAVSASAKAQRAIDKVHQNGGKETDLTTQEAKTRTHQTSVAAPSRVEQTGKPAKGRPSGLFRPIRERLWVILLATVMFMSVAVAYNLARTPEYEASVLSIGLAVLTVLALGARQVLLREHSNPGTRTKESLEERPPEYLTKSASEGTLTDSPPDTAGNAQAGHESQ
jgi:hypothetical protein